MLKSELSFEYPAHLVATERKPVSRVMYVQGQEPIEVTPSYILTQIGPDDLLVLNETKVIKARVRSEEGLEILFIKDLGENQWQVMCPASRWPKGKDLQLPGGVSLKLLEKGRPQKVQTSEFITLEYFQKWGDMPP
ncbi:MAG: S-adenosylmethionine:tRNA ribosyltransferase-isomerase, partial [Bdellovibrionales bacterium]|nr:S-adenosylmethionine:tRNA ribosyltransferase-isomerase [Bdellovibrionales bacterium]